MGLRNDIMAEEPNPQVVGALASLAEAVDTLLSPPPPIEEEPGSARWYAERERVLRQHLELVRELVAG